MNTIAEYFVPEWVSLVFLMAIPLPFLLILLQIKKEANKLGKPQVFRRVLVFFMIYVAYIVIAAYSGWFKKVFMPPMVLLLSTFPYAFFIFTYVLNTKIYQSILNSVKLADLVQLHIFRLIGVFFVILALYDALPGYFAFIAGFGDMITAISSIFVARAIQQKKSYARKLTIFWNIFGTIDILFTAIAANVLTYISIKTGTMGVDTLAIFPFCLIPAFAPPTILFIHWTIHKKLQEKHT